IGLGGQGIPVRSGTRQDFVKLGPTLRLLSKFNAPERLDDLRVSFGLYGRKHPDRKAISKVATERGIVKCSNEALDTRRAFVRIQSQLCNVLGTRKKKRMPEG